MLELSYPLLFRVSAALIIGFGIALKARSSIRTLVVKCMPIRYRVSEQFFHLQGRLTMLIAFLFGLSLTVLIDRSFVAAYDWLSPKSVTTIETKRTQEFSRTPEWIAKPTPKDTIQKDTTSPIINYEEPSSRIINGHTPRASDWFLQVQAFQSKDAALRALASWQTSTPEVRLGILHSDLVPYKILIGPFATRSDVLRYKNKRNWGGFPRPLGAIRWSIR
ncbi:MAG: SPOR domain-containing protein [Bacteroidota bacterium]